MTKEEFHAEARAQARALAFRRMCWIWFAYWGSALISACGGSVDAAEPAACEPPLHVVRFAEAIPDPGGTDLTRSVECVQPGGWSHAGTSRVWCCE